MGGQARSTFAVRIEVEIAEFRCAQGVELRNDVLRPSNQRHQCSGPYSSGGVVAAG